MDDTSRTPTQPLNINQNASKTCMRRLSVAIIDDDVDTSRSLKAILPHEQYDVAVYDSGKHALQCLQSVSRSKILMISSELVDIDSGEIIRQVRQINVHGCVVVMSHLEKLGELVAAIRQGARMVLRKPFLRAELLSLFSQLTAESEAPPAADGVEVQVSNHLSMVYSSPVMREIERQAALVARVNLPVLILGESGTGKEVLARYIHGQSMRAKNTFLKVNCAAVPSELLESELFGYEPGAFTGAGRSKPGKFKLCHDGTMFLDEIGEMHPGLQAKLLQVLQDGSFCPLGGRATERVNVRIIAATNIQMKLAIANRTFREDLYYRLNGFCVQLPPLRERREDIPFLLHYFFRRYSRELGLSDVQPSLSARMAKACLRYDWPGNLRELESFVKRYLVLGNEQQMIDELAREMDERRQSTEITAEAIQQALRLSAGNRTMAAKALGISDKVLRHRLRSFGIDPPPQNAWLV
jgi:two-component system, NtrC family, response regulator AtoC